MSGSRMHEDVAVMRGIRMQLLRARREKGRVCTTFGPEPNYPICVPQSVPAPGSGCRSDRQEYDRIALG